MKKTLELPILQTEVKVTQGDVEIASYTERAPNFCGATPTSWGQIRDNGATMLVQAEISAEELAKIPAEYHRG